VFLATGSVGISLNVPKTVEAGATGAKMDLLVRLKRLYLKLTPQQESCLNAQQATDLANIASPSEYIAGYVSKSDIGFAHYLNLVQANVKAKDSTGLVTVNADAFSLSTKVQGGIDGTYEPKLKSLLTDSDGKTLAIVAAADRDRRGSRRRSGDDICWRYPVSQRWPLARCDSYWRYCRWCCH
jgi:hypothetical protein